MQKMVRKYPISPTTAKYFQSARSIFTLPMYFRLMKSRGAMAQQHRRQASRPGGTASAMNLPAT